MSLFLCKTVHQSAIFSSEIHLIAAGSAVTKWEKGIEGEEIPPPKSNSPALSHPSPPPQLQH